MPWTSNSAGWACHPPGAVHPTIAPVLSWSVAGQACSSPDSSAPPPEITYPQVGVMQRLHALQQQSQIVPVGGPVEFLRPPEVGLCLGKLPHVDADTAEKVQGVDVVSVSLDYLLPQIVGFCESTLIP